MPQNMCRVIMNMIKTYLLVLKRSMKRSIGIFLGITTSYTLIEAKSVMAGITLDIELRMCTVSRRLCSTSYYNESWTTYSMTLKSSDWRIPDDKVKKYYFKTR